MSTRLVVVASLLAVGCSGNSGGSAQPSSAPVAKAADPCPAVIDKVFAVLARRGSPVDPDRRAPAVEACRKNPSDPTIACVNAAKDDAAIDRCMTQPKGEPRDELAQATQNLRTYYFVHETFTDQKVALTPAKPCCQFPTKKCPPETVPNEWLTKVVGLDLSKEREFQYRFESTGNKAVIEAVGDRDCDGKTVKFRRELEWRSDGNMHITVDDPPAGSD